MSRLRGGLIGCGFFARNHLLGWREVEDVEIVAVCDSRAERTEAFVQEFGVMQTYHDAEQMMREANLDFVDIVTQPDSHRALVELAAAHKTPVICQKPLAPSLEDARAMVAACQQADVPFMVHENFRWQRPMRALKQAVHEIGNLFFGRILFRSGYDPSVNQPYLAEDPRFILYDVGVHILDVARFFMSDAVQLTCQTQRVNPRIQGEDVATVLLRMQNGATCVAELSYASKTTFDPFPQTLVHLEGTKGSAELGWGYRIAIDTGDKVTGYGPEIPLYTWSTPPFEAIQDSVVAIQRHWADSLRNGTEPETSGADNLKTLELVFGSYASAEQNQSYKVGKAR
jgi:predicted dehydrogenase